MPEGNARARELADPLMRWGAKANHPMPEGTESH
jgi:hypothetical protein